MVFDRIAAHARSGDSIVGNFATPDESTPDCFPGWLFCATPLVSDGSPHQ
jgi:hypothetical protein